MIKKQKSEVLAAVVGKSSPSVEKGGCGSLKVESDVTWIRWSHILDHLVIAVGRLAIDTRHVACV